MASLYIQSNEPDFSYIINKNPASGMSGKPVKKGYMFGYFSTQDRYNIVFFDGVDELSFPKNQNQEFEYIDCSRYNSPLFIQNAIRSFLQSAINSPNEKDHPGTYKMVITSIEIRRFKFFSRLIEYFDGYKISTKHVFEGTKNEYYNNYQLTIETSNRTFQEFLNFVYLISTFISIFDNVHINQEMSIITKLVKIANIVKAPYYVKYLLKFFMIRNAEDFKKVQNDLNYDENHKLFIRYDTNLDARYVNIFNQLYNEKNVVDVGCGEGNYLSIAKKVSSKYYAIDNDKDKLNTLEKKAKEKGYDNVVALNDINDFFSLPHQEEYTVLMSEFIEHNQLEYVRNVLNKFMNDEYCKKIIITTPNKDFNKFYLLEDNESRHKDHIFEFKESEADKFFNEILHDDFSCTKKYLGDLVDDIPTTLLFVLTRKG